MQIGNISKIFYDKKYGKIRMKNGQEAHFHEYCLWNVRFEELGEGQEIEFETQITHNGYLASEIRPHIKKNGINSQDLRTDTIQSENYNHTVSKLNA
jgi:cold shock CspA family protein